MKKRDNNLIRITNDKTGEVRYFTNDTYVCDYIGCNVNTIRPLKKGNSPKYSNFKYEIVDGSMILWKNINNLD